MTSLMRIIKFILIIVTGMSGNYLNSFIVVVYFGIWRRMSDWCNHNVILLVIGLVNLSYQWCLTLDNVFKYLQIYEKFDQKLCLFLFVLQFTLVGASLWNTTWLSIYYCTRLVSSTQRLFVMIKEKFFSLLPQLMAGSTLWSVIITLPLFWAKNMEISQNETNDLDICSYKVDPYYIIPGLVLGFLLPVPMTCVSIGLSVRTLVRHIWRMRRSHLMSPQLQGHFQAIRIMMIRVFCEIFFFVIIVIGNFTSLSSNSTMEIIYWITVLFYPTSQALILVLGNSKIKKKLCNSLML
ncbi:hypothetical protein GDO81_025843, partial [Engystomops pustulosus]